MKFILVIVLVTVIITILLLVIVCEFYSYSTSDMPFIGNQG